MYEQEQLKQSVVAKKNVSIEINILICNILLCIMVIILHDVCGKNQIKFELQIKMEYFIYVKIIMVKIIFKIWDWTDSKCGWYKSHSRCVYLFSFIVITRNI